MENRLERATERARKAEAELTRAEEALVASQQGVEIARMAVRTEALRKAKQRGFLTGEMDFVLGDGEHERLVVRRTDEVLWESEWVTALC